MIMLSPASAASVRISQLSVDGRIDEPLGLDNPNPTLAWQFIQTHDCTDSICPGDEQTAYKVQAAASVTDLNAGRLIWDSKTTKGNAQQVRFEGRVSSRDKVVWRVRVWDALGNASNWSRPSTWTIGLLNQSDWGEARWVDYPDRTENQPLPLFARQFKIPTGKKVLNAYLYLAGVGMHHATVNGKEITDEVLAPGYSNWQLSTEYRTYNVKKFLQPGANTVGVRLGNGPAYVRRSVVNPAVSRNAPYSWWESQLKGNGTLTTNVEAGSKVVHLSSVGNYTVGGTINIDTAGGGDNLESRVITEIGSDTITFTPRLSKAHKSGAKVTASGNNIAASDPSAGAAVTPRLIGRLEITYTDGSTDTIVTNRSWRTKLGPLILDNWYSGSDYDARREQPGWDGPGADLTSAKNWTSAGFAPPPNLATKLVARTAEVIKIQERFRPISVTKIIPGTWVFDFGQNFAGLPLLNLPKLPAGTIIKVMPAESLNANGTVKQTSLGPGARGSDLFNTYTTSGLSEGESWRPDFNYFGMQWVQVSGLPKSFKPSLDLVTGLRVQADVPVAGTFTSSNARINRIHKMVRYSFASNVMSVFTDCPGREKLSYPADYTMPMGAIFRNVHINSLLRTQMRHLVEGQSVANTSMAGNVALKTPVYDWGYQDRFGDEINWGDAIVLVPSLLHDLYGDTSVMKAYYDRMIDFVDYIQREKVQGHIVDAALADWVDADGVTSGRITGTWGYYLTIKAMARMANITGHTDGAERYTNLASDIRDAFNAAFWNDDSARYTNTGNDSTKNATQAAQALALDAGLVPEGRRGKVLDALVDLAYDFPSSNKKGPHLSGGTIGLGPIVRALTAGGRDDVLWESLLQNDEPSYGFMMASTVQNPDGLTTIAEDWGLGASKNHMILAQIEEWFHAGIAGLRPFALSTISTTWEESLVFQPKPIGDLKSAAATYQAPQGEVRSEWERTSRGAFTLKVMVPTNIVAEVRVPGGDVKGSVRAKATGKKEGYTIFTVPSGLHTFKSIVTS
ncbi:hypothetical protein NM208_g3810 [Fusarium decemcellulare]|uniref:Uncharacterized protein n=1 Tax=Fusarium decemcellulare TaxID=57161 RepID=A0ACC1SMR4_9HYPO|nr:hypothetical protein NM208_g3810 [Fusarium decemcellulare]